ncbi:Yip1-like protein [Rhodovulum bhavnagarense]|uniref:Yip1-like protein n=1 Tax=Rhodovulum bhavnagarense TaxID=992286 RepID=A0A4R2RI59_9RHOB|nr:Yip1 family protein [Rhodovulum bhavnagarense]TCP63450.1 Yip1-like protein [Rhodovulum bhavnagarense]
MTRSLVFLIRLARDTVSDPREGARRVLALNLSEGLLWQALVLVVVVSVLLTALGEIAVPAPVDPLLPVFSANPLLTAVVQGGLLVVMVYAIHFIGRGFGGHGDFAGAMTLTVWLQFIMMLLQVAQTVFLIVFPPLAGLIGMLGIGLFFWLLSHFVTVLHGYASALRTFFGIMASMVGIVFGISLIMSLLGVTLQGALPDV